MFCLGFTLHKCSLNLPWFSFPAALCQRHSLPNSESHANITAMCDASVNWSILPQMLRWLGHWVIGSLLCSLTHHWLIIDSFGSSPFATWNHRGPLLAHLEEFHVKPMWNPREKTWNFLNLWSTAGTMPKKIKALCMKWIEIPLKWNRSVMSTHRCPDCADCGGQHFGRHRSPGAFWMRPKTRAHVTTQHCGRHNSVPESVD